MTAVTATLRQAWVGVRLLLVTTLIVGVVYPTLITVIGRLVADKADGSLLTRPDGTVVGSRLIGQRFQGDQWFLPRPSAAGDGYDGLSSGGSNLAADNPDLVDAIAQRRAQVAAREGVSPDQVPADAVTASGSGLDPHISPAYAELQIPRVARVRGISQAEVRALVERSTDQPSLGFMGEPGVNVVVLNLALDSLG
ncbi:MAG: potassium-transporting ATPase subunit KdpC [Frankiales bacterium]|nr:potassium-transporting ATPase subunit KdpC [Frankiales bacterium]